MAYFYFDSFTNFILTHFNFNDLPGAPLGLSYFIFLIPICFEIKFLTLEKQVTTVQIFFFT